MSGSSSALTRRNHPEHLDPALGRAGRFDVRVGFSDATPAQARGLFLHFFPAEADEVLLPDAESEKMQPRLTDAARLGLADAFSKTLYPTDSSLAVGGNNGTSVSMAALQGYLLRYKEDPAGAVQGAAEWAATLANKSRQRPKKKAKGDE